MLLVIFTQDVQAVGHGDANQDDHHAVGDDEKGNPRRCHRAKGRRQRRQHHEVRQHRPAHRPEGDDEHERNDERCQWIQPLGVCVDVAGQVPRHGSLARDVDFFPVGGRFLREGEEFFVDARRVFLVVKQLGNDQRRGALATHQAAHVEREIHYRLPDPIGIILRGGRLVEEGLDDHPVFGADDVVLGSEAGDAVVVDALDIGNALGEPVYELERVGREDPMRSVVEHGEDHGVFETESLFDLVPIDQDGFIVRDEGVHGRVFLQRRHKRRAEDNEQQAQRQDLFGMPGELPEEAACAGVEDMSSHGSLLFGCMCTYFFTASREKIKG